MEMGRDRKEFRLYGEIACKKISCNARVLYFGTQLEIPGYTICSAVNDVDVCCSAQRRSTVM